MFDKIRKFISFFFELHRVLWQILYGAWKISSIPRPIVTIFGGSNLAKNSVYVKQIQILAQRFTDDNISVLTGGGPGVMEAANCGARLTKKGKGRSIGIGVKTLGETRNTCVQDYFELDYLFARKMLLMNYSQAFIIFPGGFGTLDELTEAFTLIKIKSLNQLPVVLVGTEYWNLFFEWLRKGPVAHGLIDEKDLDFFIVTDDLDKAFCSIKDVCPLPSSSKKK